MSDPTRRSLLGGAAQAVFTGASVATGSILDSRLRLGRENSLRKDFPEAAEDQIRYVAAKHDVGQAVSLGMLSAFAYFMGRHLS